MTAVRSARLTRLETRPESDDRPIVRLLAELEVDDQLRSCGQRDAEKDDSQGVQQGATFRGIEGRRARCVRQQRSYPE